MNINEFKEQITSYVEEVKDQILKSLSESLSSDSLNDIISSHDITSVIYKKLIDEFYSDDLQEIDLTLLNENTENIVKYIVDELNKQKIEIQKPTIKPLKTIKFDAKEVFSRRRNDISIQLDKYSSKLAEIDEELKEVTENQNTESQPQEQQSVVMGDVKIDVDIKYGSEIQQTPNQSIQSVIIDRPYIEKNKKFNVFINKKIDYLNNKIKNFKSEIDLVNKIHSVRIKNLLTNSLNLMKKINGAKSFDVSDLIKKGIQQWLNVYLLGKVTKLKVVRTAVTKALRLIRSNKYLKNGLKLLNKIKNIKLLFKSKLKSIGINIVKHLKLTRSSFKKYIKLLKVKRDLITKYKNIIGKVSTKATMIISKVAKKFSIKTVTSGLKMIGKVMGRFSKVFRPIPVLGSLVSAWFAYKRFKEGDYPGAVLEILASALKFVPGPWSLLGWAIDIGLLAKDAGLVNQRNIPLIGGLYRISDIIKFAVNGQWKDVMKEIASLSLFTILGPFGFLTDKAEGLIKSGWEKGKEFAKKVKEWSLKKWNSAKEYYNKTIKNLKESYAKAKEYTDKKITETKQSIKSNIQKTSKIVVDVKENITEVINTNITSVIAGMRMQYNQSLQNIVDYYEKFYKQASIKQINTFIKTNIDELNKSLIDNNILNYNITQINPVVDVPMIKTIQEREIQREREEYTFLLEGEVPIDETIVTKTSTTSKEFDLPVNTSLKDALEETLINLKLLKTSLKLNHK